MRGEQSTAVLDRRMACLARNRQRTAALVHVFETPTPTVVERAITATASLPSPTRCGDAAALASDVDPPPEGIVAAVDAAWAELDRAVALEDAGLWPEARTLADDLVREAMALGYLPLVAHAHVRAAALAMRTGDASAAAAIAEAGFAAALEAGDSTATVESAVFRSWAGTDGLATLDLAERWARIALAAARHVDRDGMLEARALTVGAVVASVQARHEPALAQHEGALAIRERLLPPSHPDLVTNRAGIGNALLGLGRLEAAEVALQRVVVDRLALFGERHPQLVGARINLANAQLSAGKLVEARASASTAAALAEASLEPDHPSVTSAYELLALVEDRGDNKEAAIELMKTVLELRERRFGPRHSQVAKALNNLGGLYCDVGRLAESEAAFARAVAFDDAQPGTAHPDVAVRQAGYATTLAKVGKPDEARRQLARAAAIVVDLPADDPNRVEVDKMRASVEGLLAEVPD